MSARMPVRHTLAMARVLDRRNGEGAPMAQHLSY